VTNKFYFYETHYFASAIKNWVGCIKNKLFICPTVHFLHLVCFAYLFAASPCGGSSRERPKRAKNRLCLVNRMKEGIRGMALVYFLFDLIVKANKRSIDREGHMWSEREGATCTHTSKQLKKATAGGKERRSASSARLKANPLIESTEKNTHRKSKELLCTFVVLFKR